MIAKQPLPSNHSIQKCLVRDLELHRKAVPRTKNTQCDIRLGLELLRKMILTK